MSTCIFFTVAGLPVPKQRARVAFGPDSGKMARAYYAKRPRGSKRLSYPEYKDLVMLEARNALIETGDWDGEPDAEGRYYLQITAFLPNDSAGDVENIAGSVMDALQGLVYKDDKQVSNLFIERFTPGEWINDDWEPHLRVLVDKWSQFTSHPVPGNHLGNDDA